MLEVSERAEMEIQQNRHDFTIFYLCTWKQV